MKYRSIIHTLIILALAVGPSTARIWKEAGSDRTLEGEYLGVEDDKVLIKKSNGSEVKVPLTRLSDDDKKFVEEAQAAAKAAAEEEAAKAFKWETDFEAAKDRAKAEGKPMLVDFTGSDWCGWCVRLKKEVFDHQEFKDYAAENLVLVELDFPRRKEQSDEEKAQNKALAEKYEVRGFPTILLLSDKGKEVARTGYKEGGPEPYIEHLKELLK